MNKFERAVNNFKAGDKLLILRNRKGVWVIYKEATVIIEPDVDFKFNFTYDDCASTYSSDAEEIKGMCDAGTFAMVLKRVIPEEVLFLCTLSNTYDEVLRCLGFIQ